MTTCYPLGQRVSIDTRYGHETGVIERPLTQHPVFDEPRYGVRMDDTPQNPRRKSLVWCAPDRLTLVKETSDES